MIITVFKEVFFKFFQFFNKCEIFFFGMSTAFILGKNLAYNIVWIFSIAYFLYVFMFFAFLMTKIAPLIYKRNKIEKFFALY